MSVQKLFDDVNPNDAPVQFEQINTHVYDLIDDPDVLAVWTYLQMRPRGWKVIKCQVQKKFKYGTNKIDRIFANMKRNHLIEYARKRNPDGTLGEVETRVLNGRKTKSISEQPTTPIEIMSVDNTTPIEIMCLKNHTHGFGKLYITEETNITKTPHKWGAVDNFLKEYGKCMNEDELRRIWKKKNLDDQLPIFLADIEKRKREDHRWRDVQFIPDAINYIRGERWKDKIIKKRTTQMIIKSNELRCTVPEYHSVDHDKRPKNGPLQAKAWQEIKQKLGLHRSV